MTHQLPLCSYMQTNRRVKIAEIMGLLCMKGWGHLSFLSMKNNLFVSCNPTITSFYQKKSLPLSFIHPPNSQAT